ncbi:MAG: dTDP-4-dehydrorhamnose reductase, partial [Sphingomonas sp.]|nr:dTDP-4-dehydrorhamnose reductase [Sphingomonas sp.]
MAELGIRAVRYPILWETVAPEVPSELDFSWHDPRLERLRELGIKVIGGLVHHGSGPRYTHLLDPDFPDLLASYAARVARRYPWIEAWTPVNEPLTTARFSCLYGHWYPHQRSLGAMFRG